MADYFSAVTALDDLHSKAVKKQAGIDAAANPPAANAAVDHATALDQVDTEMFKLRETGRDLMKKGQQNTPEYDALVARSKELGRKKNFLEASAKDAIPK